jgi:hypothetical protein
MDEYFLCNDSFVACCGFLGLDRFRECDPAVAVPCLVMDQFEKDYPSAAKAALK